MVLRRLSGLTENTAPVLTLITQFGGGKTHTLTTLYHLGSNRKEGRRLRRHRYCASRSRSYGSSSRACGVFVGNAWDPKPGRETPWLDVASQLAAEAGIATLDSAARSTPPATSAIADLVRAAGGKVLILFDEVLNFVNRHRNMAEGFYALEHLTKPHNDRAESKILFNRRQKAMAIALLPDRLWELIKPLLPPEPPKTKGGRPRLSDRACLIGILFVLRSGVPWEMLPKELGCGSGMTCWRRLHDWQRARVWEQIHFVLLDWLTRLAEIDWSRAVLDACSVRAVFGGPQTGPNPTDRAKLGSNRHLMCDGQGIPAGHPADWSESQRFAGGPRARRRNPALAESARQTSLSA